MTTDEYREHHSKMGRDQRAALSKKKSAQRERMRKVREAAQQAKIGNSPAGSLNGAGRLKQSAYNLNHEFKLKTKQLGMTPEEYAQTALNLVNPRTRDKNRAIKEMQKSHPCHFLFQDMVEENFDMEEELGIEVNDAPIEGPGSEELVSKPLYTMVQLFYIRDDVSRMLPYSRCSTKHSAARVMNTTLKAAHELFPKDHPDMQISLTLFQTLRPRNVRLLGSVPLESCLCVYCTNVRLMINSLNRHLDSSCQLPMESAMLKFLTCPTGENWPSINCIDGGCAVCADRMWPFKVLCQDIYGTQGVTWSKWIRNDAGKVEPVQREGSIRDLLAHMQKALEESTKGTSFLQHIFTAFWQYRQFKICKNSPEENEVIMIQVFGENRKAVYACEIKSTHFGKSQITVHPVVCFYHCGDQVARDSIIFLSDDINHDHHAVKTFTLQALGLLRSKTAFSKVTIWSDGAASQYKGKGTFCDLSNMLGLDVQRCYFGSKHGKGESDGEILSQALKRAIHHEQNFKSASDIVDYLSLHCSNRNRQYVHVKDIDRSNAHDDSFTIPGTRKLHQFQRLAAYVIQARRLSCFCCACRHNKFDICINSGIVGEYVVHKLNPNINTFLNDAFIEADPSTPVKEPESVSLKVGDFVKLTCMINKVQKFFYAVVIEVPVNTKEFSFCYMEKSVHSCL